jgi:hypothetical protein
MDRRLQEAVRERSGYCCEYCGMPSELSELPFEIDHIRAKKHGGQTRLDNLANACFYCNSYKGPNLSGIDPVSGEIVRLFNPRLDAWIDTNREDDHRGPPHEPS